MRNELKSRIIAKYGSQSAFARAINATPQSVGSVVSGKSTPRGASLIGWCTVLDIPYSNASFFFGEKVENKQLIG